MRDDLELREHAQSLGWEIEMNVVDKDHNRKVFFRNMADCPNFSLNFKKGLKRVWKCSKGWACAELDLTGSEAYKNHRYNPNLKEVLEKEV